MMNNSHILDAVKDAETIMIAGHTRPDGDCVGSCLGLYHYLREQYPAKRVDVRLESVPDSYRVIPGWEQILTNYDEEIDYDLFISLDVSSVDRLASAEPYFHKAKKRICIDHHFSNPGIAEENHVLPDASSTCEVLADLMGEDAISYNTAFALYVGIICDSGVFKYSSAKRHTMEVAGMLMEKGVPYSDLIDGVFYRKTYLQNRLLGQCLLDSFMELDGRLIGCLVRQTTMQAFGARHEDLEGIIDQLRVTEGIEVAMLVSENPDGTAKFSLRSNKIVDVSAIAGYYHGGGHVRAAGFTCHKDLDDTLANVINMVKEQLANV